MSDPFLVVLSTIGLLVLSAFFVVIEFALLGARTHRLEVEAAHSPSARAALRGINELTIMLAAAQLGITVCTFVLGAVTKPAVDSWLGPLLTNMGVNEQLAGTASFMVALLTVTFLHLVVGEMAPKSWAIAHPEKAAKIIGIPSRIFMWFTRPLLIWVNHIANRLVAASGVQPVERLAVGGQDAGTIRHLVEHSTSRGSLEASYRTPLVGVLDLDRLTVRDILPNQKVSSLPSGATVAQVQDLAESTGHMRILLDIDHDKPRVLHVRDTIILKTDTPAAALAREALRLDSETSIYQAMSTFRQKNEQLAVVMDSDQFLGVITLSDIVHKVFGEAVPQD